MTVADGQHRQLDTGYPHTLRPELHKALMARGIDYWVAQGITFWDRDDGCECLAYGYKANGVAKLAIKVVGFTDPEQAIAATLGSGTLTAEQVSRATYAHSIHAACADADWQAIADELNATLGNGTCRDVCNGVSEFTCSACGFNCDLTSWISLFDGDDGRHRHHHHGTPNYCPNCGAKVIG